MLVSRAGLSPVMVGRDAELSQLRRLLQDASADQPAVAIVGGEAGVGKTRLMRELTKDLPGMPVYAGFAEEGDLARPYEVLRDAVEPLVTAWQGIPVALLDREHALRHVLHPLLPEHQRDDGHEHTSEELQRVAVELMRQVARTRPAVLLLEDLHWADAESIALFARLATTPGLPLALIGTFRPEEIDRRHPLAQALPAIERQRSVLHVTVGRLRQSELADLLAVVFDQSVRIPTVESLHRRTQGNPFFVEELIASCDCADPDELARLPLPWNVAEAVLRRVDHLAVEERRVLETAALLGTRVPFDLLATVTTLEERRLIQVLHVLLERRLLVEFDPDVFGFRHALTREAVASQLLAREQRRVHEAALEALRGQGSDDLAALARHAARAGRWRELVEYARTGAQRALREGSGRHALDLAELGLSSGARIPAPDELALRTVAAQAAVRSGHLDLAEQYALQWRELAHAAGDTVAEAAALRSLAEIAWHLGDPQAQRDLLAEALAVAEGLGESEELAWCLAYQSRVHMYDREHEQTVAWADRALAMADAIGSPQVRAFALVNKGTSLTDTPGGGEEGFALLRQARREAAASDDITTLMRALNNSLAYLTSSRDASPADARPLLREAHALADRHGRDLDAAKFAFQGVVLATLEGDLDAAGRELTRASRLSIDPVAELTIASVRVWLASERDQLDVAGELLARYAPEADRLVGTYAASDFILGTVSFHARRGATGDAQAALAALRRWGAGTAADIYQAMCQAVVEAASAGVSADDLRPVLDDARELPGAGVGSPAWLDAADAVVREREGKVAGALESYRQVVSDASATLPAWLLAHAWQGIARMLAGEGDRQGAVEAAQRAVELLERWPGWRRTGAEALLRRLGGGQRDGTDLLTPRERDVVALLVRGLTNREIAERLYISAKTAAVHVSNILGKTGLGSRTEVAAWAVQSGLVETDDQDLSRRRRSGVG